MCWEKGIRNQLNAEHISSASDYGHQKCKLSGCQNSDFRQKTKLDFFFSQNCSLELIIITTM